MAVASSLGGDFGVFVDVFEGKVVLATLFWCKRKEERGREM